VRVSRERPGGLLRVCRGIQLELVAALRFMLTRLQGSRKLTRMQGEFEKEYFLTTESTKTAEFQMS
jgi:hypothetical protein